MLVGLSLLSTWSMASSTDSVDHLVIHMKAGSHGNGSGRRFDSEHLGVQHGVSWKYMRTMALDADVVQLPAPVTQIQAQALLAQIQRDPAVDWAVIDGHKQIAVEPNDKEFGIDYAATTCANGDSSCVAYPAISHLWYLQPLSSSASLATTSMSINLEPAWDQLFGATATIAVVDTGTLPHTDLDPQRTLAGYDFISNVSAGNNGLGRNPNASDPGDWISQSDLSNSQFKGCAVANSSWHGTFVSGVLAAIAGNDFGIAGVNPKANIVPVRVLGKCGGDDSDIVDGMLWAGGNAVSGVSNNANPASVINLSLGGSGSCNAQYQTAVDTLVGQGRLVVVAAGNNSQDVSGFTPAGCQKVVAVAATARSGYLTDYSNFGAQVALAAPGGGTTYLVSSTSNSGLTTPSSDATTIKQERGTSFATPLVGGVASLLIGRNPALTVAQVEQALFLSATPFPQGSDCDSRHCGHGIVNANGALLAANHSLTVAPTRLDFGTVVLNTPSPLSLVVSNPGSGTETLGTPVLESAIGEPGDFATNGGCAAASLTQSGSCTVVVTFTPTAAAGRYAVLDVPLSDTVLHIPLYGVGAVSGSVLTLTPSPTTALASSSSATITLTNTSAQGVFLQTQSLSGATVSNVACVGGNGSSLNNCHLGGGATFTFTLTRSGQSAGSLSVSTDVGGTVQSHWAGRSSGGGGGGGCTVVSGQFDVSELLLLGMALWVRRRRR